MPISLSDRSLIVGINVTFVNVTLIPSWSPIPSLLEPFNISIVERIKLLTLRFVTR